jgi:phage repressor protein C with HTH and peptisase S24 domain
MDLDPIRLKIMKLIQNSDSDLKNASIAIGRNAAYLHQYLYRGTPKNLPEDAREALAAHLGVDDDSLRPPSSVKPEPFEAAPNSATVAPTRRRARPSVDGFVAVSELDVRASAGAGALFDGLEESRATWLFPDPVIRHEFRARPEDLRILTIDGDSMEPLLSSGDRILIDTSQRVPVPPGIFVIWDGMGIVAKRVEHVPNSEPATIVIKSVNPDYKTYERGAEEVNIIGRVIWSARRL